MAKELKKDGDACASELTEAGAKELLVANRSPQRAEELAREVEGVPVSLAELPSLLERADVAICSTGATQHVVTREMVARTPSRRNTGTGGHHP